MIDALITGKLHGAPQQRISKTGRAFVTAKLRVPTGESATFCNVVAFDQGTQDALMTLTAGEAVALAGELRVSTWTDKSGTAHPSLDLVASRSLTQYHLTKRRRTMQGEQDGGQQRQPYRRDDFGADPGELDNGGPLDF